MNYLAGLTSLCWKLVLLHTDTLGLNKTKGVSFQKIIFKKQSFYGKNYGLFIEDINKLELSKNIGKFKNFQFSS